MKYFMKKIYLCCFAGLTTFLCSSALASEQSTAPDFLTMAVRMFSVLAIILGALFLVLYFMKKMNFTQKAFLGSHKHIDIIDRLYLGPKKSVVLMKAGSDFVLIGLCSNQITFLSKIDNVQMPGNTDMKEKDGRFYKLLQKETVDFDDHKNISNGADPEIFHNSNTYKKILQHITWPYKRKKIIKGASG